MIDALRVRTVTALAAALLLVLAGCTGGVGPTVSDGGPTADGDTEVSPGETTAPSETLEPSSGETSGESGSVTFYLSDAPIEEFEHLNVTVTKVGIQRADEANESNESGWIEYDVENRTVDLTDLRGSNATSLGVLSAPAGNYSKVFVHVDEVEGILNSGEEVNVKLPSQKLQINSEFAVAPNSSSSFVFDISVFEAGNSGKHILKPVVSESGTGDDVEIRDVDEEADEEDEEETEDTEESESESETGAESEDGDDGDGPPDDAGNDENSQLIGAAESTALQLVG
jgi:hypothetical protein